VGAVMALIDTNVIVRFLTGDTGDKYENLCPFFESLEHGKIRVELKLIVMFQVIFVLESFYEVPKNEIVDAILSMIAFKGITIKEKKIVRRALQLWKSKNLEMVDCYLLACLERDAQNILYSYDHDFDKFEVDRREP
jgi:predicted nucleic acid-binding protein